MESDELMDNENDQNTDTYLTPIQVQELAELVDDLSEL